MNNAVLRSWLLKAPRPVSLRVTTGDDKQIMPISPGESWASIAKSVVAMTPDLVEALDDKAQLLRAFRSDDEDELDPEVTTKQPVVAQMIDVGTLQLVSKLLAEAYKHSTETAFARLADLFAASAKRSENLEKSLATAERALRKQVEDQLAGVDPADNNLLGQMMTQFLAGQHGVAAPPPTNGKGHS